MPSQHDKTTQNKIIQVLNFFTYQITDSHRVRCVHCLLRKGMTAALVGDLDGLFDGDSEGDLDRDSLRVGVTGASVGDLDGLFEGGLEGD